MAVNYFRLGLLATVAVVLYMALVSKDGAIYRRAPVGVPTYCEDNAVVAMTFDEGPSKITGPVLDALKTANIKITFHVTTPYLYTTAALKFTLDRAYREGHLIGLRLPNKNYAAMSDDAFKKILRDESKLIYDTIQKYPRFLRLPSDQVSDRVVRLAQDEGFVVSLWNIDTNDYTATSTLASITSAYKAPFDTAGTIRPGFISVHRDNEAAVVYNDVATLASIIKTIQDAGYRIVTMDQCLKGAQYRTTNGALTIPSDATSMSLSSLLAAMTGFVGALFY